MDANEVLNPNTDIQSFPPTKTPTSATPLAVLADQLSLASTVRAIDRTSTLFSREHTTSSSVSYRLIDHIFCSTELLEYLTDAGITYDFGSDHRGIFAEFSLGSRVTHEPDGEDPRPRFDPNNEEGWKHLNPALERNLLLNHVLRPLADFDATPITTQEELTKAVSELENTIINTCQETIGVVKPTHNQPRPTKPPSKKIRHLRKISRALENLRPPGPTEPDQRRGDAQRTNDLIAQAALMIKPLPIDWTNLPRPKRARIISHRKRDCRNKIRATRIGENRVNIKSKVDKIVQDIKNDYNSVFKLFRSSNGIKIKATESNIITPTAITATKYLIEPTLKLLLDKMSRNQESTRLIPAALSALEALITIDEENPGSKHVSTHPDFQDIPDLVRNIEKKTTTIKIRNRAEKLGDSIKALELQEDNGQTGQFSDKITLRVTQAKKIALALETLSTSPRNRLTVAWITKQLGLTINIKANEFTEKLLSPIAEPLRCALSLEDTGVVTSALIAIEQVALISSSNGLQREMQESLKEVKPLLDPNTANQSTVILEKKRALMEIMESFDLTLYAREEDSPVTISMHQLRTLADNLTQLDDSTCTRQVIPWLKNISKLNRKTERKIHRTREEINKRVPDFWEEMMSDFTDTNDFHDHKSLNYTPQIPQTEQQQVAALLLGDISEDEIRSVIANKLPGKSPGYSGITNKILKHLPNCGLTIISHIFNACLQNGIYPDSWKRGLVSLIYKNDGSTSVAENFRPITLLENIGKIYGSIITKRLSKIIEEQNLIPNSQQGFRPGRGTTGVAKTLVQIVSESKKNQTPLQVTYIDLVKAFDKVSHSVIRHILQHMKFPETFTNAVMAALTGGTAEFLSAHGVSRPIEVNRGVRQGDIISPSLFILAFAPLLWQIENEIKGVTINELNVTSLAYADDLALITESPKDMAKAFSIMTDYCQAFSLSVNARKSGQAWNSATVKKFGTPAPLFVDKEKITPLGPAKPYKYLGIEVTLDADWSHEFEKVQNLHKGLMEALRPKRYLRPEDQIRIANVIGTAIVYYHNNIVLFPRKILREMDNSVISILNSTNGFHSSTAINPAADSGNQEIWSIRGLHLMEREAPVKHLTATLATTNNKDTTAHAALLKKHSWREGIHTEYNLPKRGTTLEKILAGIETHRNKENGIPKSDILAPLLGFALYTPHKQRYNVDDSVWRHPLGVPGTDNIPTSLPAHELSMVTLELTHRIIYTDGSILRDPKTNEPTRITAGIATGEYTFGFQVVGDIFTANAESQAVEAAVIMAPNDSELTYIGTDSETCVIMFKKWKHMTLAQRLKSPLFANFERIHNHIERHQKNIELIHIYSHLLDGKISDPDELTRKTESMFNSYGPAWVDLAKGNQRADEAADSQDIIYTRPTYEPDPENQPLNQALLPTYRLHPNTDGLPDLVLSRDGDTITGNPAHALKDRLEELAQDHRQEKYDKATYRLWSDPNISADASITPLMEKEHKLEPGLLTFSQKLVLNVLPTPSKLCQETSFPPLGFRRCRDKFAPHICYACEIQQVFANHNNILQHFRKDHKELKYESPPETESSEEENEDPPTPPDCDSQPSADAHDELTEELDAQGMAPNQKLMPSPYSRRPEIPRERPQLIRNSNPIPVVFPAPSKTYASTLEAKAIEQQNTSIHLNSYRNLRKKNRKANKPRFLATSTTKLQKVLIESDEEDPPHYNLLLPRYEKEREKITARKKRAAKQSASRERSANPSTFLTKHKITIEKITIYKYENNVCHSCPGKQATTAHILAECPKYDHHREKMTRELLQKMRSFTQNNSNGRVRSSRTAQKIKNTNWWFPAERPANITNPDLTERLEPHRWD